jgi:hypothetical protein
MSNRNLHIVIRNDLAEAEEKIAQNEVVEKFDPKNLKQNLKIIVENIPGSVVDEGVANEIDLIETDDLIDFDATSNNHSLTEVNNNYLNRSNISGNFSVSDDLDETEDVEFHVNLDKAPPTLQNTTLVIF